MRVLFAWAPVPGVDIANLLPLGIGYLAANLPKRFKLKMWDGILNRYQPQDILEEVKRFKPDVVCFSVWNFNLTSVGEMASLIKKSYPSNLVLLGGPAVSGYKERIFDHVNADFGFAGEGEKPLSQFLALLSEERLSRKEKKRIHGLIYRDEKANVTCNPVYWEKLTDLAYCDYRFINFKKYIEGGYHYSYSFHPKDFRVAPILTTRGCPFPCEYCSARRVNGVVIRTRSIESILSEISELYSHYNVRGFNIIDDNFTFRIEFAKKVCRAVLASGLEAVSFNSPNGIKVEYLDRELLDLMRQVGWRYLFISPESGSERTLKAMHKLVKLSEIKEKIALIKQFGIKVFGYFIIGYPGETASDIKRTIDFAYQNDFDSAIFTCFMPLPGTPVYEKLLANGEITESPSGIDFFRVSYAPKGMSKTQLKLWRLWALLRFYTSSRERFTTALSVYPAVRLISFMRRIMTG